ncbi:kinase-like protein [Thozetella sp. PMI_491]|nr:kinase-like protein [Thozetella sp. PMI_491]
MTDLLYTDSDCSRDCYTFAEPRLFTGSFPAQNPILPCNFITFLAAAQKLGIPFLPLTWQAKRELLGRGGTSQVNQALVNLQTSFAFKRVAFKDKMDEPEGEILQRLINEMTVLRNPTIQDHPNILELQGICWDVPLDDPSDGKIWPVLVFEKSQFGDLRHFAKLDIGRNLSPGQRLELCLEIGSAIAHMHSSQLVHGDIKPQNVLVFKDDSGSFTAKVADFGFSTQYALDNHRIMLPESKPWFAPECLRYPGFSPQEAVRTDIFSFGMLCLWFIFERHLSGILPSLEGLPPEIACYNYTGEDRSLKLLAEIKDKGALEQIATSLVMLETDWDDAMKDMLKRFFRQCLPYDPASRAVDMQQLLQHIHDYRY